MVWTKKRGAAHLHGRLVGHTVEPVAELLPFHHTRCLACEHEEGRLEGVFGVVVIPEDPAADGPDHRAVAMHDRLEDGPLPSGHEAIQELPVRKPSYRPHAEDGLEVTDCHIHPAISHTIALPVVLIRPLTAYYPVEPILIHFFLLACQRPHEARGAIGDKVDDCKR